MPGLQGMAMKTFKITIENDERIQMHDAVYANEGYARLSLYHVMVDMLDRAIKESFAPIQQTGYAMPLTESKKEIVSAALNASGIMDD